MDRERWTWFDSLYAALLVSGFVLGVLGLVGVFLGYFSEGQR